MDWKLGTFVALGLSAALVACGDDGGGGGSESDGSSGGSSSSTTTTTTTTTSTTTSTSTTTTTTTTTSTTTDTDTDTDTGTTGGTEGVCVGYDLIGTITDVLSRDMGNVGGMCTETPDPCGGDVVGEWTFENQCGEQNAPNIFGALCPGATQTVTLRSNTGTITFNGDDTFDQQFTTDLEFTLVVDVQTCLGITCAQFQGVIDADPDTSGTCSGPDTACDCNLDYTDITNVSGTYAIANNELAFTVDDQTSAPVPFCVSNDRLDLWTPQYQPTITEQTCMDAMQCEMELGNDHELYDCDPDLAMNASLGPRWDLPLRP